MARSSFLNKSYRGNICKCLLLQLWADFCQKRTIELSRHNARNLPDPNQCYHWLWQLHFEVTTVCGNLGLKSFLNKIEVTTICGNFGLKLQLFVVTSVGSPPVNKINGSRCNYMLNGPLASPLSKNSMFWISE